MFTVSMGGSPLSRAYLLRITRISGRHDVGVTALHDMAGRRRLSIRPTCIEIFPCKIEHAGTFYARMCFL